MHDTSSGTTKRRAHHDTTPTSTRSTEGAPRAHTARPRKRDRTPERTERGPRRETPRPAERTRAAESPESGTEARRGRTRAHAERHRTGAERKEATTSGPAEGRSEDKREHDRAKKAHGTSSYIQFLITCYPLTVQPTYLYYALFPASAIRRNRCQSGDSSNKSVPGKTGGRSGSSALGSPLGLFPSSRTDGSRALQKRIIESGPDEGTGDICENHL
ncbi:unnamed protein product [Boreogadus saida]